MEPLWVGVAEEVGISLDRQQTVIMGAYRDWLRDEAIPAGGIGPAEADRLDTRHISDSLLFLAGFGHETPEVWDLGTGVGLPGIPLAIALPGTRFHLIDRSGRRVGLLRRVIRILGLSNCSVVERQLDGLEGTTPVIVSRASLPPARLTELVDRHLEPGGIAVVAGSWMERSLEPGWEVLEFDSKVLDRIVWLLIMRRE